MSKTNKITNAIQYEKLVDFMEKNPELALGQLSIQGKSKSYELWRFLTIELNAAGPPTRNMLEWKKVWSDFKYSVKNKIRKNKIDQCRTGGPFKHINFTQLEDRLADLLNLPKTIAEGENIETFEPPSTITESFSRTNDLLMVDVSNISSLHSPSVSPTLTPSVPLATTASRKRNRFTRSLLKEQINNQKKYHKDMVRYTRKLCDLQKKNNILLAKNIKLKKEMLEFEMQKFEEKKRMHSEKMKISYNNMLIKQLHR